MPRFVLKTAVDKDEDLTKENRMLRALIAGHGKKENPQ